MDVSGMFAWAVLAMLISGASQAAETEGPVVSYADCVSNCVTLTRHRNHLLIDARNGQGEVFKTLSFSLPPGARRVAGGTQERYGGSGFGGGTQGLAMLSDVPTGGVCVSYTGVCTETAVVRYQTSTHVIIYTFTFVFNDGELVEVRVDETRVAQSKLK